MGADLARVLDQRRGDVERSRSVQGKVYSVNGFIDMQGAGEALVDVNFPVAFQERPSFSFGAELGANQVLEDGNFPWVNAMVRSWQMIVRDGISYYTGASVVVVASGPNDMAYTAHWTVTGKALTNPLNQSGSAEDVI